MKQRSFAWIGCVLAVGLFFSSCPAAQSQSGASDFTLQNLQGQTVTLSDFQGKENVLLVFGATWCVYCSQEIPELNELQAKYGGKGLKILNVDIGEPLEKVRKYVERKGVQYEVLLDEDGSVAQRYGVYGIPANFLIDKQGEVLMSGQLDVKRVEELMAVGT